MTVAAYDLDGVLAAPVPASFFTKPWRHMSGVERSQRANRLLEWYATAPLLHVPTERSFHVITARKEEVRSVTQRWLEKQFGKRVLSVCMLSVGRTVKNVVEFKAASLRRLGVTDFTEDNRTIVRALRRQDLRCRVWHYVGGRQVLDYEPGFL